MHFSLVLSALLGVVGLVSGAMIPLEMDVDEQAYACQNYCAGTAITTDPRWVCGDIRLGPVNLPIATPVGELLLGYRRFGGLCPRDFLAVWSNTATSRFNYPSESGFQLTASGLPLSGNITLPRGTRIDRFGVEFGVYLAPVGTPYGQRAIPPLSLSVEDADAAPPFNYHVYEVIQPFQVLAGPIAPWFGQQGQGTQYKAHDRVINLVAQGFLRRLNSNE